MNRYIPFLFVIAAAYDGILGVAFLVAPLHSLELANIPATVHPGYIQFSAALLIVFAMMYLAIAGHPVRNANLIPYGMMLKVAYCTVVFRYWLTTDLPFAWKPFAMVDLVFLALFWMAWMAVKPKQAVA
jgi:hypothetical protein